MEYSLACCQCRLVEIGYASLDTLSSAVPCCSVLLGLPLGVLLFLTDGE
jgi:hypothetical protein